MTAKVGVRELKANTSEIVRQVREEHATFDVTYRGEVVARIVPLQPPIDPDSARKSWQEWETFLEEVSKEIKDGATLEETMAEIRRDL